MIPKKRLAILTTHPIQYQVPWFRFLATQDWVEPCVLFGSDFGAKSYHDREFGCDFSWDIPMLEGYPHQILQNTSATPSMDMFMGVRTPEVMDRLRSGQFDAVLALGWHTLSFWQGFRAAYQLRLPLILRGESNLLAPRSFWREQLRQVILGRLFANTHAFLAIGSLNREFYRSHGVPDSAIKMAPYFVDHHRFQAAIPLRVEARRRLGIQGDEFVFLFSGKLVGRKRPKDLLAAWNMLPTKSKMESRVLFLGDGELRHQLEAQVKGLEGAERIQFLGFRNQKEIPEIYAASDALVMPSDYGETWGLSANEAMATGARIIVSDRVGCGPDLVHAGVTGEIFGCGNMPALRGVLQRYIQDREWVCAPPQREAVLRHAANFTMERATAALRAALEFSLL